MTAVDVLLHEDLRVDVIPLDLVAPQGQCNGARCLAFGWEGLNDEGKVEAGKDRIKGWTETHVDDDMRALNESLRENESTGDEDELD